MAESTSNPNSDIASLEASLHALAEREARFRTVAESSPTGVFLADVHGTPTYANQRLLDWFAMDLDAFASGAWFDLIHPEDVPVVVASMDRTVGKSEGFDEEYRIVVDGRTRWIRVRTQPVMGADGTTAVGQVGSVLDTTAERFAAEERDRLQAQLQQARKLESLGLLAGGVAHDFNNLLVGILGNASLARAVIPLDGRGLEVLDDIERAAKRASELTQQLLAYAGRARVDRYEVNIGDLVGEMPALLGGRVPSSVSLAVALPAVSPVVDGDETQLRQVILNLVTNAVEAVGGGHGRVEISVSRDTVDAAFLSACLLGAGREPGSYVVVTARDTGAGMNAEVRERMFDPFYSTKAPGRGLGLAAALGIMNAHGGAIRVTSEVGVGTTVSLLLPAVRGSTPYRGMPALDPFERTRSGAILLVDDDSGARTASRRILARVGYTVIEAGNGQEALEKYDTMAEPPSCVVLDLSMPIMGGDECLRELRRRGSTVPVLLISGYDAHDVARHLVDRGDATFLQKPYSASELLNAVHSTVGAS